MSYPPVQLEIGGQIRQFEYDTTEVNIYRCISSVALNHVVTMEYGTQQVYIFDHPNLLVYLSGMEIHGHTLKDKQLQKVATEMDKNVGWNADVHISDEAPEEVRERYVRIATPILRNEIVTYPKEWNGLNR